MVDKAGLVKLIDFGQSCRNGTIKERIQGTPDYIAPEQVQRKPITYRTDVFNLGATMYWLLTGRYIPTMMPNAGLSTGIHLRAGAGKTRLASPVELRPECSPGLSELVMACIAKL